MAIHLLERTQLLPISVEECWAFFSDPRNLEKLTPPSVDLKPLGECPPAIYAGMMIQYRVRPLLGIPMSWLTEITHVDPLRYFADSQRIGPYRLWNHEHFFKPAGPRSVEMRDRVHYALPFGFLGDLMHAALVRKELERIFAYREEAVRRLFPG